jgi:HEAT repeat protein
MARGPSAYFRFWAHFDNRAATWRDGGPQVDLFGEMTAVQRRRTEHELLHRLARDPTTDGWVLTALGTLRSEEAVPMLRDLVRGPVSEDAAIALWRISRWRGAVKVLDGVVRARSDGASERPPTLVRRIEAARYLAEIGSPSARASLVKVAADNRSPLRLQRAIESLLRQPNATAVATISP